jgi:glycosyltransferase involved in cell wall biosynthesis
MITKMKIGIDLSALQGDHRLRGIGSVLINVINNVSDEDRVKNDFVFFVLPKDQSKFGNPFDLLDLRNLKYEVRTIKPKVHIAKQLPGKLNILVSVCNNLLEIKDLYLGDSRIKNLKGINSFFQVDPYMCLPRKFGMKNIMMAHDIIPYVLESDYLWSYRTARRIHGFSRKAALRTQARRMLYIHKMYINYRRADAIIANSIQTKNDFINYLRIPRQRIIVTTLGVSAIYTNDEKAVSFYRYIDTAWGYARRSFEMSEDIPFILYIGGADRRRKLQDLVAAFNHIRAEGYNLRLVLVGDCMQGPNNISTEEIQTALRDSSYLEDIIFMGFVENEVRDWLYKHALTFVFPSVYEGFGLPVLEAMAYGCPVIGYRNAATEEVAGRNIIYANGALDLNNKILEMFNLSKEERQFIAKKGITHARKYSWDKAANQILSILSAR